MTYPARSSAATIALLGALDTKAQEVSLVADELRRLSLRPLIIDTGVLASPRVAADVDRRSVAEAGGASLASLIAERHSGRALAVMGAGVKSILSAMAKRGELVGVLAVGGSRGTTLAAGAMRELPLGLPKIIVAPSLLTDMRSLVGSSDIVVVPTVADLAGVNRITAPALVRAARMLAAWLGAETADRAPPGPTVAITSFGVTTPCVDSVREQLLSRGIEVVVFPANGIGGPAMERLAEQGAIDGVIDVTTHELADTLLGGTCATTTERLRAVGRAGLPQVVSLGALDIVNFPAGHVPARFAGRRLYQHSSAITLMRTDATECELLGRTLASRTREAHGPTAVVMPAQGFSEYDRPGGPFWLPEADRACISSIESELTDADKRVVTVGAHINEPGFARLLVSTYLELAAPISGRAHCQHGD